MLIRSVGWFLVIVVDAGPDYHQSDCGEALDRMQEQTAPNHQSD